MSFSAKNLIFIVEIIEISIAEYKLKKDKLTIHYKISDEHP